MSNYRIINNIRIYGFNSKKDFLNHIKAKKKILIAMNAEKIMNNNIELKKIINNNIGYPDGVGAVLALKQKGLIAPKIAGSIFWLDIIEKFVDDKKFYFIGSKNQVIQKTILKLKEKYKNIKITGYRDGFFKDEDINKIIEDFKILKPDIIFVAQGSPKQEFIMNELFKSYPAIYMGLGGSFDIFSNYKKKTPKIFITLYLEWFYRLIKEPYRIKRNVVLFKFLFFLLIKKI